MKNRSPLAVELRKATNRQCMILAVVLTLMVFAVFLIGRYVH